MTDGAKKGELFSRQYMVAEQPLPDSERARVRTSQYFQHYLAKGFEGELVNAIPRELGVEVPFNGYSFLLPQFFRNSEVRDFLSTLTLVHRITKKREFLGNGKSRMVNTPASDMWLSFVRRTFLEENLAFTVDDECGIHPLVDKEYQRNIAATLAGLGVPRYAAVRTAFESAQSKLEANPADLKGAIRDVFEALETLTKLMTDSGAALTERFVQTQLERRLQHHYQTDPVALRASASAAQSFADWINSAHTYRHGQNAEEPVAPPIELTILLVSQGASFLRWLVELDGLLSGLAERKP